MHVESTKERKKHGARQQGKTARQDSKARQQGKTARQDSKEDSKARQQGDFFKALQSIDPVYFQQGRVKNTYERDRWWPWFLAIDQGMGHSIYSVLRTE